MIYTLEAAANKFKVDPVNIMEFVYLGLINIYSVGCKYNSKTNKWLHDEAGMNKWSKSDAREVANSYMAWHDYDISMNDQEITREDFNSIRFLESELTNLEENNVRMLKEPHRPSPIQRATNWNECIIKTMEEFYRDNNYEATTSQEVMQRLLFKSPAGYIINDMGEDGLSIDGSSPTTRNNLIRTINRLLKASTGHS